LFTRLLPIFRTRTILKLLM